VVASSGELGDPCGTPSPSRLFRKPSTCSLGAFQNGDSSSSSSSNPLRLSWILSSVAIKSASSPRSASHSNPSSSVPAHMLESASFTGSAPIARLKFFTSASVSSTFFSFGSSGPLRFIWMIHSTTSFGILAANNWAFTALSFTRSKYPFRSNSTMSLAFMTTSSMYLHAVNTPLPGQKPC